MSVYIIVAAAVVLVAVLGVLVYRASTTRRPRGDEPGTAGAGPGGRVDLQELHCRNCGAELGPQHAVDRAGGVWVSCPYCDSTYQVVAEAP